MNTRRKRSPENHNHHLHYEGTFSPSPGIELPVMTEKGPMVSQYLYRLNRVFEQALEAHKRVLVIRLDLRLPQGYGLPDDDQSNQLINRFIDSLKNKIKHDRKKKMSPHDCPVRYAVAREIGHEQGRVHFHVLLLLNGHAYYRIGQRANTEGNLFWKIAEAWANALRIPLSIAETCVHYSWDSHQEDPSVFRLDPRDTYAQWPGAFYRASYLCKANTKRFGQGHWGLMTSRV